MGGCISSRRTNSDWSGVDVGGVVVEVKSLSFAAITAETEDVDAAIPLSSDAFFSVPSSIGSSTTNQNSNPAALEPGGAKVDDYSEPVTSGSSSSSAYPVVHAVFSELSLSGTESSQHHSYISDIEVDTESDNESVVKVIRPCTEPSEVRLDDQREYAAITIQKNIRGHQTRRLSDQRELAAIKIQKSVRGHQARRLSDQMEYAAITIQKNIRGHQTRRLSDQREMAAIKIQKNVRGHQARRLSDQREYAAITIQKNIRGHQTRRKSMLKCAMEESCTAARSKIDTSKSVTLKVIPKISSRILKVGDILTVENFSHIFSKAVIRDGLGDVKNVSKSVKGHLESNILDKKTQHLPDSCKNKTSKVIPKTSSRILKVGDVLTLDNFSHIFSKAVIRDGLVDIKHVSESVTAHLERNILDKRQKMPDNYKENVSENHPIMEKAPGVDVEALCTFFEENPECKDEGSESRKRCEVLQRKRKSIVPDIVLTNHTETEKYAQKLSERIIAGAIGTGPFSIRGCYV